MKMSMSVIFFSIFLEVCVAVKPGSPLALHAIDFFYVQDQPSVLSKLHIVRVSPIC